MTRIPVYFTHTPAGTSVKNICHFAQLVRTKTFQMYDYGRLNNLVHYHSFNPPVYNINNIQTPVTIVSGSSDWLSTPQEVRWTAAQLPGLVDIHEIEGYNHLDFIWGMSAGEKVYSKIIKDILSYEEQKQQQQQQHTNHYMN